LNGTRQIVATDFNPLNGTQQIVATDFNPLKAVGYTKAIELA